MKTEPIPEKPGRRPEDAGADAESDENEFRRIDTGMYTDKAAAIADELRDRVRLQRLVYAGRDKDGQVYFLVRAGKTWRFPYGGGKAKDEPNPFFGKSDAEVLSAIADELKSGVETTAYDRSWEDGWWSRKSARKWMTSRSIGDRAAVGITVADAFKAYNVLKGVSKRPDKRVVGRPLTSAEVRRAERAKERAKAKSEKERAEWWKKTRRIGTGLYGDKTYELLRLLCGHYWFRFIPKGDKGLEDFVTVRRAEDNEIYLEVRLGKYRPYEDRRRNPFFGMRQAAALARLGAAVKAFAVGFTKYKRKCRLGRDWWSASNGEELVGASDWGFSATVSDAYRTAAALAGGRPADGGRVLGRPLTKKEIKAARDAKAAEDAKAAAWRDYADAVNKLRLDYVDKLKAEADRLWKKFTKKIHEIDPAADPAKLFPSVSRPNGFMQLSPCAAG